MTAPQQTLELAEDVAGQSLGAAPCSVERTHRSVIERKLLTALEDDNTVAALLSRQDLEDMIAALYGYELGERTGNVLSWAAHLKRRKELADSMSQLLREAFPPNESSSPTAAGGAGGAERKNGN